MFKSLIRTLPSLTGNICLNCRLNSFKTDDNYVFSSFVRNANLLPLQNSLYDKIINVNLLEGSWEYDVRKFYRYYSNYFYETNFEFNKKDYQQLDIESDSFQKPRNIDYEFGCKRLPYQSSGYQFCFFAPIYIDNAASVPDSFLIDLDFGNNLSKKIRVFINENSSDNSNYLFNYISRYAKKIDDNVIYMLHESNQAVYFGIDADNGSFVQIKDNVIGSVYIKQNTMNNFDNTVNEGFKRNHLIMKQIIPLAFSFNISDILSEKEKRYLWNSKVKITGHYEIQRIPQPLYDFSSDYKYFTQEVLKYDDKSASMKYKQTSYNLMDVGYPSLQETRFCKQRYTNNLTKMYNRWKLKYSSDDHPYITNINYAFSYNQGSNYKYGEFPHVFTSDSPAAVISLDSLDTGITEDTSEARKFKMFMNNYVSDWFTTVSSYNTADLLSDPSLWVDVSENTAFYKGILYNLENEIRNSSYSSVSFDKFAVFAYPSMNIIDNERRAYTYFAKILLNDTSSDKNISYFLNVSTDDGNHTQSYAVYDVQSIDHNGTAEADIILEEDPDGDYIDISKEYNAYNQYYRLKSDSMSIDFENGTSYDLGKYYIDYKDAYVSDYIIYSREFLPIGSNNNLIKVTSYNDTENIFDSYYLAAKENDDPYRGYITQIRDSLLISQIDNEEYSEYGGEHKSYMSVNYISDISSENQYKYSFFAKSYFIEKHLFDSYFSSLGNLSYMQDNYVNDPSSIYEFVPVSKEYSNGDMIYNVNYFKKKRGTEYDDIFDFNNDTDYIYLDLFNFINFVNYLNSVSDTGMAVSESDLKSIAEEYYFEIGSKDMLLEYLKEMIYSSKGNAFDSVFSCTRGLLRNDGRPEVKAMFSSLPFYSEYNENLSNDVLHNNESLGKTLLQFINNNVTCTSSGWTFKISESESLSFEKIYGKKSFIRLTEEYKDLIGNYNGVYESLFIYRKSSDIDIYDNTEEFSIWYDNDPAVSGKLSSIYDIMIPVFLSPWKLNNESNKTVDMFLSSDLVKKISYNGTSYYKYSVNPVLCTASYSMNDITLRKYAYSNAYEDSGIKRYSVIEDASNGMIHCGSYSVNNLNVISYNGLDYAFYMINAKLNNTNRSFNTLVEKNVSSIFSYINGEKITEEYLCSIFKQLVPFMTNNLFSDFTYYSNAVTTPAVFDIVSNYRPVIIDNGNTPQSYLYDSLLIDPESKNINNIFLDEQNSKHVKLTRYMNRITPLITEVNDISYLYQLKYKSTTVNINDDNMYFSKININRYPGIYNTYYYDLQNHADSYSMVKEHEYKYFNDNNLYNLCPEFYIKLKGMFEYSEILEKETYSETLKQFRRHVSECYEFTDDEIEFLYNKYKVEYISDPVKFKLGGKSKYYTLTYRFLLN